MYRIYLRIIDFRVFLGYRTKIDGNFYLIIFLLHIFFVFGCRNKVKYASKVEDSFCFENLSSSNSVNYELNNNKPVFIGLETTDNSLVGKIKKVVYAHDSLYIFDKTNQALFLFDKRGKYLNKINNRGKGPGEYIEIIDFDVDDDFIAIADNIGKKILLYNKDMQFVKLLIDRNWSILKVGLFGNYIHFYGKNINRIDENFQKDAIVVYSKELKYLNTYLLDNDNFKMSRTVLSNTGFIKFNANLYFTRGLEPVIYKIENDIYPWLTFKFAQFNKEEYASLSDLNDDENQMHFIGDFYPLKNDIYFCSFRSGGKIFDYLLFLKDNSFIPIGNKQIDNNPLLMLSKGVLAGYYSNGIVQVIENNHFSEKFNIYSKKINIDNGYENIDYLQNLSKRNIKENPIIVCWEITN